MQTAFLTNKQIYERLKAIDPAKHEETYQKDDKSNGKLFANMFGDILRYNVTTRSYVAYDGTHWIVDFDNLIAEGLAQRLAEALHIYSEKLDDTIKDFYHKLGHYNARKTMLAEARNFHAVSIEDFDRDKYLLNVRNGTLDLRTLEFREHRADDLLLCVANVDYDPEADCPIYKRFMSEVTSFPDENGSMQEDPDKAEYLQRILGYCLVGECVEDEFYILYGSTTRNGKSTLLSVIGDILGDYGEMIEPDALSQGRRATANDEQIADLKGKRFAHVEEPSKQMVFDTGLIKKLTGRSKLTASRKYEHRFSYMPEFKIVLATNYLPTVLDDTLFKSGRCKVITFDRHFSEEEQDKDLRRKLKAEASGILNWMLEGLKHYKDRRTQPPASVVKATEDYRQISDRIENFLKECTEEVKDEHITLKELYEVYTEWCKASGYSAEGKQKFSDALKRKRMLISYKQIKGVEFRNIIMNRKVVRETPWEPVGSRKTPF